MKYLHTRIAEVEYPARDHAILRFAGDEEIPARPGEFVMVRGDWGVHPVLPRAFSLVEAGAVGSILVKAIGEGTERLAAMTEGDELVVFGPLGHGYTFYGSGPRPVLVAGGVGVAPLLFLTCNCESKPSDTLSRSTLPQLIPPSRVSSPRLFAVTRQ